MYSSNIQLLLLALILASLTAWVVATSYDKYDPGFGIYDDGFSNNDYAHYRTGPKYTVEQGAYPARPPPRRIGVAYGRAPSPPHYSAFY